MLRVAVVCVWLLAFVGLVGPWPARANRVQTENARLGDSAWSNGPWSFGAIEGYASSVSASPGDTVELHVNAPGAYRVEVSRLGWYGGRGGRRLLCLPDCESSKPGVVQPQTPPPDPATGFLDPHWSVTDHFTVPSDWVSGYYVAVLYVTGGPYRGQASFVPIIIRRPPGDDSAILVEVPVNTWQAYNNWGGKSLYAFNSTGGVPATRVSFNRPKLGQSPYSWDYQLVRFLEREGADVSYVTDVDVHRDPGLLRRHRLVMTAGHDEYWTREMRDGFDDARNAGTNLAFMGADTGYWQLRYDDAERTLVEYRSAAADPNPDPATKTVLFRTLGRDECQLEGVQYTGGAHGSNDPPIDYPVNRGVLSDPWMAGTGFGVGDVAAALVGYEYDTAVPCSVPTRTVLFHYDGKPNADAVRYTAPSGARVFASGTMQFSWGLDDWGGHTDPADARLQKFTRNLLDDETRPAPPGGLAASVVDASVALSYPPPADGRISAVRIYRHQGPNTFSVADSGVTLVCTGLSGQCADAPPPGIWRYGAATVDRWGSSALVDSNVVSTRPAVNSPADGSLNNTGNVTVSGTAEPGSTVEVFDGATSKGTTTADGGGNWSKALTGVADGSHTYTAKATDAAGNTSAASNARTVTVDTHAPSPPAVNSPADGSLNNTGNVTVSGTAEPGSTVEVFDGATSKGTTTADGGGNWSKALTGVADGSHTYTAKATDAAGNTSAASNARTVTVVTSNPNPNPNPTPTPTPTLNPVAGSASFAGAAKTVTASANGTVTYWFSASPLFLGTAVFERDKAVAARVRRRRLTLGWSPFMASPTGAVKVSVKLSKGNLKALKKLKRFKVRLAVTVDGRTFVNRFTLKALEPKRRKR